MFTAFWEALLSQDADGIAAQFERSGSLLFGGVRRAEGRRAVRREFVRLFSRTDAIHHRPVSFWARDGVVVADADVEFELEGGRHVEIPVTTVCWFRGGGIERCELSFYPEPSLGTN